jgi:2-polyprenyl-3-methyl-5-hydroxy-6-metoxy-1,4-benzoquinol methylase
MMEGQRPRSETPRSLVQREAWNAWIKRNFPEHGRPDSSLTRIGHRDAVLKLLKSLELSSPEILEVGCANGWLSSELAAFGKVTGTDLADEAVAEAKTLCPSGEFVAGDFLTLDLSGRGYDVVISVGVMQGVDDQRAFVQKLAAVTKHRGWLILICPNKYVWDRTDFARQLPPEVPVKWLYMRQLKYLLRPRFTVVHHETILPAGNRGLLRLVNSRKINIALETVIDADKLTKLKERVGLGKSLVAMAQKSHRSR